MTNKPPLPADDPRQWDELDAFLDDLAHGNQASPPSLDPTLAVTVRHVHDLASEQIAADTRRAAKAHRWEDLMRTNAARSTVTPFPTTATLPRSSASPPIPLRPVMSKSRLRRLGGQSLGLVATLTLVLLVAASSLALYLSAPQGGDDPTMLPAAFGASPEVTATATPASTQPPPSDAARVTAVECTVEPLEFEDVMSILSAPSADLPFDESYVESFNTNRLSRSSLASGAPVEQQTREELSHLYGAYLGCYLPLQQARIFSDAGLLRFYRTQESPLLTAQLYELLWLDQQGDVSPPGGEPASLDLGRPGRSYLYDFRMIGLTRVGAYIALNQSNNPNGSPRYEEAGFVVFVPSADGQWFIDEVRPVPAG